ncbi:catalytic ligB subunit of aromatic ring-opening dioxygenase domain-containing protein [Sarocladium implicatum]|nr:catalytic ligB subunit of aromatic ring-opening dioxygenase domain-containing protein [Sarocladium implicatum]
MTRQGDHPAVYGNPIDHENTLHCHLHTFTCLHDIQRLAEAPLLSSYNHNRTSKDAACTGHCTAGPMPLLGDPHHKDIIYSLSNRVPKILGLGTPSQPKAIVLVTAHWGTSTPHISSGNSHSLLYDYGGFPEEAYNLTYPASGDPEVAKEVEAVFKEAGLKPIMDSRRGWDHGVFVPMLMIDPKGTVPVVQVSILRSEDPSSHFLMGKALHSLRSQNIAIIGSGFASFHNLRVMLPLMRAGGNAGLDPESRELVRTSAAFNSALTQATLAKDQGKREEGLKRWREFEGAYTMHPRNGGDHFMPLIVCAGAAGDGESGKSYVDKYLGVDIFTYYWGSEVDV